MDVILFSSDASAIAPTCPDSSIMMPHKYGEDYGARGEPLSAITAYRPNDLLDIHDFLPVVDCPAGRSQVHHGGWINHEYAAATDS
jgi:hypothetical protein